MVAVVTASLLDKYVTVYRVSRNDFKMEGLDKSLAMLFSNLTNKSAFFLEASKW